MKIRDLVAIAGTNLEMLCQERDEDYGWFIYRASVPGVDAMSNGCLSGISGIGDTPEDALVAFAKQASKHPLAIHAGTDNRINLPKMEVTR